VTLTIGALSGWTATRASVTWVRKRNRDQASASGVVASHQFQRPRLFEVSTEHFWGWDFEVSTEHFWGWDFEVSTEHFWGWDFGFRVWKGSACQVMGLFYKILARG
jgi:hypothetical protein